MNAWRTLRTRCQRSGLLLAAVLLLTLAAQLLAACDQSTGATATPPSPATSTAAPAAEANTPTTSDASATLPANTATPASDAAGTLPASTATPAGAATESAPAGVAGVAAVPVNPQSNIGATTTILNPGVVSWVHIGDLHITTADQQNYADFQTIIASINQYLLNGVNFALLPGDNANDHTTSEYQLIKQVTDKAQVPIYAIPGDHDSKAGLTGYLQYMEPVAYQSFTAGGYHFVFLDVMSGISADEQTWLTTDLNAASAAGLKSVLFMHSYNLATSLQALIQKDHVIMVDAGHTHYNDVANDGQTIYAATRSTGQVTEGPVGFSIVNLDNGVISWKFKPLGSWPFVMITSPSDKQLMIDGSQVVKGAVDIRAKIWDDKGVASATYQIDGGTSQPLQRIGATQMWSGPFDSTKVSDGDHKITVNVTGAGGNTSSDTITVAVIQAGTAPVAQRSFGPSGNSIGSYTEKGLLGNHTSGASGASGAGGKGGKGGPAGHGTATIVGVAGDVLTVKYADGTMQQVLVTSSTQITKQASGTLNDLQPGAAVDIRTQAAAAVGAGTPTAVAGTPIAATQITIHGTTGP